MNKKLKIGAIAIVVALCFVATATVSAIHMGQPVGPVEKVSLQMMENTVPSKPATPEPQFEGYLNSGEEGTFITRTTCADPIRFTWNWGNGVVTISEPVESGEDCIGTQTYEVHPSGPGEFYGIFFVKVQAENIETSELSAWSDECMVVVRAYYVPPPPGFELMTEEAVVLEGMNTVFNLPVANIGLQ